MDISQTRLFLETGHFIDSYIVDTITNGQQIYRHDISQTLHHIDTAFYNHDISWACKPIHRHEISQTRHFLDIRQVLSIPKIFHGRGNSYTDISQLKFIKLTLIDGHFIDTEMLYDKLFRHKISQTAKHYICQEKSLFWDTL